MSLTHRRNNQAWTRRDDRLISLMIEMRYPMSEIVEAAERSSIAIKARYRTLQMRRKGVIPTGTTRIRPISAKMRAMLEAIAAGDIDVTTMNAGQRSTARGLRHRGLAAPRNDNWRLLRITDKGKEELRVRPT